MENFKFVNDPVDNERVFLVFHDFYDNCDEKGIEYTILASGHEKDKANMLFNLIEKLFEINKAFTSKIYDINNIFFKNECLKEEFSLNGIYVERILTLDQIRENEEYPEYNCPNPKEFGSLFFCKKEKKWYRNFR